MSIIEVVLLVGGLFTAGLTIVGVIWWLVWPRIEDKLQDVVRSVGRVEGALGDDPDTIGRHARVAASAAAEIPALRTELRQIGRTVHSHEKWRHETDRRLRSVEGALIALLGPELRRLLFHPDTTDAEDAPDNERNHP